MAAVLAQKRVGVKVVVSDAPLALGKAAEKAGALGLKWVAERGTGMGMVLAEEWGQQWGCQFLMSVLV